MLPVTAVSALRVPVLLLDIRRAIGNKSLVKAILQSLESRRKIASLSVFYELYSAICVRITFAFSLWTCRVTTNRYRLMLDNIRKCVKSYDSSFLKLIAKMRNLRSAFMIVIPMDRSCLKSQMNKKVRFTIDCIIYHQVNCGHSQINKK